MNKKKTFKTISLYKKKYFGKHAEKKLFNNIKSLKFVGSVVFFSQWARGFNIKNQLNYMLQKSKVPI